ncbi:MAG: twin-arginine translocase subunit TatC [Anaerolineae bacterium]|nr:twin-arginine translocase subunit TatC [Anaerolineae bacterium]
MTNSISSMGLFEHLVEMRRRVFRAVVSWILATVVAMAFSEQLIAWLVMPLKGGSLIVLSPTEAPIIYFKVALAAGFGVALPMILYQLYGFVAPGLFKNERQIILMAIPSVVVFFLLGALFTLQVLMPISLPILMGFLGEVVEATYSLEAYLGFVTTLVVWMGIIFQTPLLVYLIARLGLLTRKQLAGARRIVWFLAVIFAAVVTPTTDPVTLLLVTGPFIGLYELGLLMARVGVRQKKQSQDERDAALDAL